MDYIQTSNKVTDQFGPGAHGFGPGDPAAGHVATYLSPDWCNGIQQEIMYVMLAGGQLPTAGIFNQLFLALQQLYGSGIRYYPASVDLPTTDRGPIWSAAYNSIMTWQVFDANGATFEGYASQLIGSLLADTQPTPRTGYIASGRSDLSIVGPYAALRAWAMHHGTMVAVDAWVAGRIACADNTDGATFRVYDVRAEFPRFWDNGRGVVDQGFGDWLDSQNKQHTHEGKALEAGDHVHGEFDQAGFDNEGVGGGWRLSFDDGWSYNGTNRDLLGGKHEHQLELQNSGGNEARPRSTALLAAIKF